MIECMSVYVDAKYRIFIPCEKNIYPPPPSLEIDINRTSMEINNDQRRLFDIKCYHFFSDRHPRADAGFELGGGAGITGKIQRCMTKRSVIRL